MTSQSRLFVSSDTIWVPQYGSSRRYFNRCLCFSESVTFPPLFPRKDCKFFGFLLCYLPKLVIIVLSVKRNRLICLRHFGIHTGREWALFLCFTAIKKKQNDFRPEKEYYCVACRYFICRSSKFSDPSNKPLSSPQKHIVQTRSLSISSCAVLRVPWGFLSNVVFTKRVADPPPLDCKLHRFLLCSSPQLPFISDQQIRMIPLRHLLINTCRLCRREYFAFLVSLP